MTNSMEAPAKNSSSWNNLFKHFAATALCAAALTSSVVGQTSTQPLVAIHDSELTRALETMPASGSTPTGAGTTGFQWWTTDWHYFVMPESLKEALRSDGTAFTVIGDSNITAGLLLANGAPKYPIVISFASEAMNDSEIAPLTNYVAAGGFLVVGGSAFTRTSTGVSRGDFALANQMGVHMLPNGLANWTGNNTFNRQSAQRIVSHIPDGPLTWRMPSYAEEINWGISPGHVFLGSHDIWQVQAADATVIATGDSHPFLTVKPYGKGYFIYDAAFQPLVGHGGFAPGMYAYVIVRKEIEWAFEACKLPVPKLSPWPFQYDAAFMIRHDLEDFTNEVADLSLSAQFEASHGVKGDYYFCTGTLRQDAGASSNTIIANLRTAVTSYGATVGPHNGGLPNPDNSALLEGDYDFWHWGPDEVLDFSPAGYANGTAYATASVSNSFKDIETWLSGLESSSMRVWVAPNFNATRENSYKLQSQLGVKVAGDQKISPFPHWTLSTQTPGLRYSFLSEPVSDWFVGGLVAQSLEPWHPPGVHTVTTMENAVDYYYSLGALVNVYSHTLSTGEGDAGQLTPDYITYSMNTTLHPRLWSANAVGIYQWWLQRSNSVITVIGTNLTADVSKTTFTIKGSSNTNEAVELEIPNINLISGLSVLTNNKAATGASFRTNNQFIRVQVGMTVTNVVISYTLPPVLGNDFYYTPENTSLVVAAPGVLANDVSGVSGGALTATVVTSPSHGTLVTMGSNGSFTYKPATNFTGTDTMTYRVSDGQATSQVATITITVMQPGQLFSDSFARPTSPAPIAPWTAQTGNWTITNGSLVGTGDVSSYGNVWYNNTNWTDYTVQGQVQFSSTSGLGGGLGGHLNPTTGAHYAAWVYPENSAGGSAVLKLIKFEGWQDWSGSPMQTAIIPGGVGTNLHTVAMTFQDANVSISFDGTPLISATDNNYDGVAPLTSGGITADMYTDANPYKFTVDNVIVTTQAAVAPVTANSDSYAVSQGGTLNVVAPGVLANDTGGSNALTASLVANVLHGTLNLNASGAFTYVPTASFTGTDSFSYQASDGHSASTASVTITVNPTNSVLFSDTFSDSTVAPWVVQDGTWSIVNAALQGVSPANGYGNAYVTNSTWTDYTLSATVQMSSTSGYGGGIGGRLNPATGAHYAAWIYPEASAGGSAVIKLVKFEGWNTWSFTAMQTASLPAVGTSAHTIVMTFKGANITVTFDGAPVINATDNNFDSVAPYTSGGITADLYTDSHAYNMSVDNVTVSTIAVVIPQVVANNDSYVVMGGNTLSVAAPGVLGNDTGGSGSLTASLLADVAHGTLNLSASGAFTYTPANGFSGTDSFTYQATDGNTAANATVTISVTPAGVLFSDDFTSSVDPGPLSPWAAQDGTWAVTGGRLLGQSAANSYGNAYLTNSTWTDYSYQAQVAISSTVGYGGGIGGRLNPATGAHYAAWVYPEGSAGGSAVMKLVKFEGWNTWSFTAMQTASLPAVGTNYHTVVMTFQGANITVTFDGSPVINVTDNNFDSVAPYTSGGITADLYTDSNPYGISVDNVLVSTLGTVGAPSITGQPASRTNNAGTTATFTVGASGSSLSYQWFFNASAISGANSATLTLANVASANAGSYTVTVTNSAGSVTSSPATLTVITPPAITTQPASQTNGIGSTATFTVVATGTAPTYQWKFNGANIAGATASAYSKSNVQTTDAGSYTVAITNAAGSVTSSAAVLTVVASPVITTQPASRTNAVGTTASFSVTATGTGLAYQWKFNGNNIAGATTSAYSKASVQTTNAGDYTVTITNAIGSVTSSPATLTVIVPPAITTQPNSRTNLVGTSTTFTVVATGTAPTYQWKFNGANIAGATTSSYTDANVQATDAGSYTVLVTNLAGSVTSSAAVLTVVSAPAITTQPLSQTVIAGQNASFSVTATGSAPLKYQWKLNGTNIAGATGAAYTVSNAQPAKAGSYSVAVTNALGSINSTDAVLTVNFSLTAVATTGGTISVSPNQTTFAPNAAVTITATPAAGYVFTGWTGNASGSNNPLNLTMTANLSVTANFLPNVADVIVDNKAATYTGTWSTGTASNEYATDYRYASGSLLLASATATFKPAIVTAGKYDVYVWSPTDSSSSTKVPYLVTYSGGSASVNVNETTGQGSWQLIASGKTFAKGTAGSVKISNNSGDLKRVTADAVRFVYSSAQ